MMCVCVYIPMCIHIYIYIYRERERETCDHIIIGETCFDMTCSYITYALRASFPRSAAPMLYNIYIYIYVDV